MYLGKVICYYAHATNGLQGTEMEITTSRKKAVQLGLLKVIRESYECSVEKFTQSIAELADTLGYINQQFITI